MAHDREYLLTRLETYSMYTSFVELRAALLARSTFSNVRGEITEYVDRYKKEFAQEMSQVKKALAKYRKHADSTISPLISYYDALSSSNRVLSAMKKRIKKIKVWMVEKSGITMGDLLNLQDSDLFGEYFEVLKYCFRDPKDS